MAAKRRGYLQLHEEVEMGIRGLTVWAYSRNYKFLGKVQINRAGLSAWTGKKANRRVCNLTWEQLFERLEK
jgi:hypothetical protein